MHGASFLNRARNSRCTVITDLDTSKRSTQKASSCCDAILETSPAVSTIERTAGSSWETWTVAAAKGVCFARVRWEINFLLTFETASFICKHPVHLYSAIRKHRRIPMADSQLSVQQDEKATEQLQHEILVCIKVKLSRQTKRIDCENKLIKIGIR